MKYCKLETLCRIQYGFPFDSKLFNEEKGTPLVRIRDVVRGVSETYTTESAKNEYLIQKDDILIGMDGEFNVAKWKSGPAYLNQRVCKIIPIQDTDKDYLFHFLPVALKRIEEATPFVTVKHLSAKALASIDVPFPEAKIRTQISSTLNTIRDLFELRKGQLKKIDQLASSRFVEMFGDLTSNPLKWKFASLSEVCDVRDGTHDSPSYVAAGYPLLTSKNFSSGYIDWSEVNYISKEDFDKIAQRSKVDCGDIVMPMIGTIGHPVIVDTEKEFAIKNVALIKFCGSSYSNVFIKAILDSDYFKRTIEGSNRGGTQKFIALGDIRRIRIPTVPFELQNEFAAFIEQLDKSKVVVKKQQKMLEIIAHSDILSWRFSVL